MPALIIGSNNFGEHSPTAVIYTSTFDDKLQRFESPTTHSLPIHNSGFIAYGCNTASKQIIYVADECSDGRVHVVSCTGSSLSVLNSYPCPDCPCHISATKTHVVVSCYVGAKVHAFEIDGDALKPVATVDHAPIYDEMTLKHGALQADRCESAHPHTSTVIFGKWLVTADLGSSTLTSRPFPPKSDDGDAFTSTVSPSELPGHAGCRSFVQFGNRIYLVNELSCTLSTITIDAETGRLTETSDPIFLLEDGEIPNRAHHRGAGGLILSPDGRFIFCTTRQTTPGKIVIINRETMTVVDRVSSGGDIPRHLSIVDRFLFVCNQGSKRVVAFSMEENGVIVEIAQSEEMEMQCTFVGGLGNGTAAG